MPDTGKALAEGNKLKTIHHSMLGFISNDACTIASPTPIF